jgi:hypothetical protein
MSRIVCVKCKQPIRWVRSVAGKRLPIQPDDQGRVWLDVLDVAHTLRVGESPPEGIRRLYANHYAVCPGATSP